jgi:hypothetical protein
MTLGIHVPKLRIIRKQIILPVILVGLVSLGLFITINGRAHATAVVGWDSGNIVSNAVFTNKNSMSVSQIQAFLNAQVPICDTAGLLPATEFGHPELTHAEYAAQQIDAAKAAGKTTNWTNPPYVCLRDYSENTISSAQIIYNIAQQYQINPQVLIVLLEKEQGLVLDTWPLAVQYRSATGYGCPDTSVCATKYYGLTAQLTWSATMFHTIITSSQSWSNAYGSGTSWYSPYALGNNTVFYNPGPYNNAAGAYYGRFGTKPDIQYCSSTTVNIQNLATVAMYDYTPYQPNQAALNSSYGSGDTCSSYGNRNFYEYFNNWFGSTQIPINCVGTETPQTFVRSFYNPRTFDHFYSAFDCDINFLQNLGYINEGAVFNTTPSTATWAIPIYRYYNPTTGMHVWSTIPYSVNTPAVLAASNSGYQQEAGIVFYVARGDMPNVTPIMSFYNPNTYLHVLGPAPSQQVIDNLKTKAGYNLEGPAFSTQ